MKRILSLDLARGFTVLMIAPIHVLLVFSKVSERSTLLAQFLAFIAEWHGAQIFMLIMGISFAFSKDQSFSKKQSIESVFQRAIILLSAAYSLNLLKFVLPHVFGWLPPALLQELQIAPGLHGYLQLFLFGDILHFAAIALIVLLLISRFQNAEKIAVWLSVTIIFLAPLLWDATSNNAFINYDLELIEGQPPIVFFPVLPWLVYPLIGLAIGGLLLKNQHQNQNQPLLSFDSFWLIGLVLMILTAIIKYFLHDSSLSSFYRTTPLDTVLHIGFVLIALSAWQWISLHVKANALFKLFSYCSRRITQIYIIQWLLICWLIPVFGYEQTGFAGTVALICLTSFITLSASLIFDLIKTKKSL